ncbi:MAG: class I SAM-dependent methyltransferase [Egibacteraceae bacterium]
MDVLQAVREYWNADAATYDRAPSHGAASALERAAWTTALRRALPEPPARVLDVGAGTGFLSLLAARLGHEVTALDLSPAMLAQLSTAADREGLKIRAVEGPAHEPPQGPFDAVIERHLLWVLPQPSAALTAWRAVAPGGLLALFEGLWGAADPAQARRRQARELLRKARRRPADHHASFDPEIKDILPFGRGIHPNQLVEAVTAAGWPAPSVERLRDVEWARLLALPPLERLLGTTPQYVVTAVLAAGAA